MKSSGQLEWMMRKKQAEDLFNDLGMNLTTAFTIFVKQAIREQGIPFEITRETLNGEILAAFKGLHRIIYTTEMIAV